MGNILDQYTLLYYSRFYFLFHYPFLVPMEPRYDIVVAISFPLSLYNPHRTHYIIVVSISLSIVPI